ncbi:MAG: 5-(carboxyamino)imidazole ribonucleotide mutase [Planctomycetota bacterium]
MSAVTVGVVMGSASDLPVMEKTGAMLAKLEIPHEMRVISAHRTPHEAAEYATAAADRGIQVLIAGAGGSAALAGTLAAHTNLPVIGIPVDASTLSGVDALYSCAQMPPGFPVATVAIGEWGAMNSALLAARILSLGDEALAARLAEYREGMAEKTRKADRELQAKAGNA